MYGRAHLFVCALSLFYIVDAGVLQKNKITFVKVEFIASDPKVMFLELNIEPKSENEQEVSGNIFFSEACDTETYDTFKVKSGSDTMECEKMQLNPLISLPEKDTKGFMNDIYKPFIMDILKGCSNMPQFEGDWGDRSVAGNYTLDKCIVKTDPMQPLFSKGNYCLFSTIKREIEPKFNGEFRVYVKSE